MMEMRHLRSTANKPLRDEESNINVRQACEIDLILDNNFQDGIDVITT